MDRTKLIDRTVSTVSTNLLEGALIVIFVLVVFLGNFRAGLIVAGVIPLAMLFAVAMMNLFGVSANLMSMGALDFGLIVDGAVIVVESLLHKFSSQFRNKKLSQTQMDAEVTEGSSKIMSSAVFGQIIILIVYIPIFALRGIEGKIDTVRYAREHNIPFFGICLGMQMAVIEYARNVLGLNDANSTEMNPDTKNPVIDLMESQKTITDKGGTMRLGSWKCNIKKGTLAHQIYHNNQINERHRHRFEYNNKYAKELEKAGLISSGVNPDTGLVEIVEIKNHPFFIGVQYHPEYKSTVANPHPIFVSFVAAMVKNKKK